MFSPCPDPGFQILFSQLCPPRAPAWEAGKCCHTEAVSAPTAIVPGEHRGLAPVLAVPGTDFTLFPGQGFGTTPGSSQLCDPKPPRVCQHCQSPLFHRGWLVGLVGSGAAMGPCSAPLPGNGSQAETSLLLSHLRSSTWKTTRTGTRLSCSAAKASSPKTTSRSSHTRKYHPTNQATIPISKGLPRARVVPPVGKLSHRDGVCLPDQSASSTKA